LPVLSVVTPILDEEELLPELHARLAAVLDAIGEPWEIVVVDDGSVDRSRALLEAIAAKDARVRAIFLSRNFGHQAAITAGLDHARGRAVVVIDGDLQDPPEVIKDLVARWRAGFQVVFAVRSDRAGETVWKRATARLFYELIRRLSGTDIPVNVGDFRLMDRKAVDALLGIRERHRFVRGLVTWIGFSQTGVSYARAARSAGETKYPLTRMVRLALDAIFSFSTVPLQISTWLGLATIAVTGMLTLYLLYLKLVAHAVVDGMTTMVATMSLLGGVQLLSLGIVGSYVGRIFEEVKRRPLYVIERVVEASPAAPAPAPAAAPAAKADACSP
jgi:dolichol-phosphate mannosyltransferase